jgi:hypothetical protein
MARLTIYAGHYGSGKTQIAVNRAFWLRRQGKSVILCDLDIVNPYFRTADYAEPLREAGIRLIVSSFANSNVETASLPPDVNAVFDSRDVYAVMDIGGDDRGMLALSRYASRVRADDFDMLLVVNPYRPLATSPEQSLELLKEMEAASGLPFNGIVSNPNLGKETTLDTITAADPYIKKLSQLSELPVIMTCTRRDLAENCAKKNVFPLDIYENRFCV